MKKLILKAALLLATTLALPMSAHAVVVWDWSWSGTDIGSGTLTTDDLSVGSYLITDMTGTWNTANINGAGFWYPMINYGGMGVSSWDVNDFFPAIYVKTYIDEIFDAAGYSYTSAFFSSSYLILNKIFQDFAATE